MVWVPGVAPALHDPGADEAVEAVLEYVRGDAEPEEVVEADGASEQCVPDDQQTPTLTHQFKCPRGRAYLRVVCFSEHATSIAISLAS